MRDGLCNECRQCQSDRHYSYYRNKKDRYKEKSRKSYKKNKEKVNARAKEWASLNPEKARDAHNKYMRKILSTPKGKLCNNIRSYIGKSLKEKKAGRSWESLVGYSLEDLMAHIEKRFLEGMSWENYGEWHIDHIKPVSKHDYESADDEEFMHCWSLSNLQPLWAIDNLRKKNRLL